MKLFTKTRAWVSITLLTFLSRGAQMALTVLCSV